MFTNHYPSDLSDYSKDISLHGGIPRKYYHLINKDFTDWEIPPWELIIYKNELIGEGSFSKVYLAKWRETIVVAKVLDEEIVQQKKELVLREIDNMTKLHHPNIVQILGYIDEPFIIIMEYIPKGNLLVNNNKLNLQSKKNIMKNILQALAYFHNRKPNNLIHRDIKPTNVLLTNSLVAKITDFGLSKFNTISKEDSCENLIQLNNPELTSLVGTERYLAPEMPCNNYTNKIDIYATGILLYEMFENKRYNVNTSFKWYKTPKKIRTIINDNMLNKDPNDRKSALTIIQIFKKEKIFNI